MNNGSSREDRWQWMRFNPNDWWQEPGLRAATLATRGAWIDICCLMWKSPHRGILEMPDGCPPNAQQMQRLLGCTLHEWRIVEGELYGLGIAAKSKDGRMICRRMTREADEQRASSLHGRKAAEARWKNARRMPGDAFRESESPRIRETKNQESDTGAFRGAKLTGDGLKRRQCLDDLKARGLTCKHDKPYCAGACGLDIREETPVERGPRQPVIKTEERPGGKTVKSYKPRTVGQIAAALTGSKR